MTRLPTRNRSSVNWYIEVGSRRLVEGEWWRLVRRDELERFKAEDWHEIKRHAVDLLLAEAALVVEGETRSAWGGQLGGRKLPTGDRPRRRPSVSRLAYC